MKKILFALIATTASLSGVSIAHAEGAYLGAGVVASRFNFDQPGTNDSGNKVSGKFFGGYEIDKMWGVEAGYTDFGSKSFTFNNGFGGDTDSHAFYVAGKASMPINEQFSAFGKLGVVNTKDNVSGRDVLGRSLKGDSKTGLYASIGGQYAINKNVALTAEIEHYGKSATFGRKADALAFGVRYSFN